MIERLLRGLTGKGWLRPPTELEQRGSDPVADRATRSLAHDVLVAAVEPESGRLPESIDWAVRVALLVELRRERRIEVSGSDSATLVTVVDPRAMGDRELDMALRVLDAGRARKVVKDASYLPNGEITAETLVAEGALVEESYTRFGLFAARRLQVTPSARRDELVDRLRSVLVGGSDPDERTALLVVALDSFVPFKHFLPKGQVKPARKRAAEIVTTVEGDYRVLVGGVKCARANGSSGDVSAV